MTEPTWEQILRQKTREVEVREQKWREAIQERNVLIEEAVEAGLMAVTVARVTGMGKGSISALLSRRRSNNNGPTQEELLKRPAGE